jgi:GT2 family glycosyltransferase
VIVATRERPTELSQCLDALRTLRRPAEEIIVVDNAPLTTRTAQVAERAGVSYVVEPTPGLSRARNRGAAVARSSVLAYIDDDAIPQLDWLDTILAEFDDPLVGAVTGRCVPSAVGNEETSKIMKHWWPGGLERKVFDRTNPAWAELALGGGIGVGMNMAVKRDSLAAVGGFDVRMGRGGLITGNEEHDLFFRILDSGQRIVYTPRAVVHHPPLDEVADFSFFRERAYTAYVAHLLVLLKEKPTARRAIARLVWRAMRGNRRTSRTAPDWARGNRKAMLKAVMDGGFLWVASLIHGVGRRSKTD